MGQPIDEFLFVLAAVRYRGGLRLVKLVFQGGKLNMRYVQDGGQVNHERYRRLRYFRGCVGVWYTILLMISGTDSISLKTNAYIVDELVFLHHHFESMVRRYP